MRTTTRLAIGASAFAAAALVAPMNASAAAAHCDMANGTKYEVGGDRTRINLDLAAGTSYCIKVGTKITQGVVGADGDVVNKTIKNSAGKLMGISYYVVYKTPPCEPSGSSGSC